MAVGTGEPRDTTPTLLCSGVRPCRPSPLMPRDRKGLTDTITDTGQSLGSLHPDGGAGGFPLRAFNFGGDGGVADVAPARLTIPGVKLQRL